jgi:FMN-dependent NADH-azoreductase
MYKGVLMVLLNIQTSPRGSKSISIAATDAFVEAYRTAHPDVTIDNLNVWKEGLPEFDSEAIGAKYKGVAKEAMSDAESAIWRSIQSLAARFQAADLIVLGVPMWNFAYPYKLKQLIDLVCQRNFLFTFSEGKFGPLLKTRNAVVIYSRGQTYAEHSPTPASLFDHQKGYIDFWLHFVGVEKTHSIVIENTWSDREAETLAKGKSEAIRLVGQL